MRIYPADFSALTTVKLQRLQRRNSVPALNPPSVRQASVTRLSLLTPEVAAARRRINAASLARPGSNFDAWA